MTAAALAPLAGDVTHQAAYRRDIDGLRAIAVTSVVLYHAVGWMIPGGFVGVDIFFAISGFLIGGIINREIGTGKFHFVHFYARRARRILPALIALILAICAIGLFFYSGREYAELALESGASLIGVSNIKFWLRNDYFASAAPLVPLLMTWSLGVEEQFYVGFPVLLLLIRKKSARVRMAIIAAIALLSLILSIVLTATAPWAAFYLLPTRAWEMGSGALLALWLAERGNDRPIARGLTETLGVVGLGMIVLALFGLTEQTPFPGIAAALPVCGTVALIAARGSLINRRLLGAMPLVGIGLISYSWYLWHWPLMSLVHSASDGDPADSTMLLVALASLIIAYASWRWIERPFRYGALSSGTTLVRFGSVVLLVMAPLAILLATDGVPARLPHVVRAADALADAGAGDCQLSFGEMALGARTATCTPANGPLPIIAVIGDSHANALGAGLAPVAARNGYRLWQVQKSACFPFLGVATATDRQPDALGQCAAFLDRTVRTLAANTDVRTIVLAGAWPAPNDNRFSRADGATIGAKIDAVTALHTGLPAMIDRFRAAGKQVIVIGDVPHFGKFDPLRHARIRGLPLRRAMNDAVDPRTVPGDRLPRDRLDSRFMPTKAYVTALARSKGVTYLDLADQFCDPRGCRHAVNGVPMFVDATHMSALGSRMVDWSAVIRPAIVANAGP